MKNGRGQDNLSQHKQPGLQGCDIVFLKAQRNIRATIRAIFPVSRGARNCVLSDRKEPLWFNKIPSAFRRGDFVKLVRVTGLEPVCHTTHAPQTCLSASSSTPADIVLRAALNDYIIIPQQFIFVNSFFKNYFLFKDIFENQTRYFGGRSVKSA